MALTAVAFLLLYLSGCIAALSKHPKWGLMTYVATFYLHPPGRWWGESLPSLRWSLICAIITFIAYHLQKNKLKSNGNFLSNGIIKIFIVFILWISVEYFWSVSRVDQVELIILNVKYMLLMYLIYRIIDTPETLRIFLYTHVLGCFMMGWVAYTTYHGGRFEGFAPPNINEANAGALQLVTGAFTVAGLFFYEGLKGKILLIVSMVFILNGIVTTISRSAFIELSVAAIVFNKYIPSAYKKWTKILTLMCLVAFLGITSNTYWNRIDTIKAGGENIEGVDTGHSRVVLFYAQLKMFKANPFGYGHRGTAYLSPLYLQDMYLTGQEGKRFRSSHNTFMTMLAEHGVVGVCVYLYMIWWVFSRIRTMYKKIHISKGFISVSLTITACALTAIFVGDEFVDYLILESRFWFLAILMILPALYERTTKDVKST